MDALAREGQARFHFVRFVGRTLRQDKLPAPGDRERTGKVCLGYMRWGGQTSG